MSVEQSFQFQIEPSFHGKTILTNCRENERIVSIGVQTSLARTVLIFQPFYPTGTGDEVPVVDHTLLRNTVQRIS